MSRNKQQSDFLPEIRVGKIRVLKVHQVSDEELTRLGQNSGQSLFLNFGISVLSVAASFLATLLTTQIASNRSFIVFVIITVVGVLAGVILLVLWWCTRQPMKRLVKKIQNRMPPEGEAKQLTALNSGRPTNAPFGADKP